MNTTELKNWKLKEVLESIEVIEWGASSFIENKLLELGISPQYNDHFHRGETFVAWSKMPEYHKFFFDKEGWEDRIKRWFEKSKLGEVKHVIITYLQEEVVIKVPTDIFFADWEGFVRSTLYNGLFLSGDYKLIMEVSRDYFLHSNFKIEGV